MAYLNKARGKTPLATGQIHLSSSIDVVNGRRVQLTMFAGETACGRSKHFILSMNETEAHALYLRLKSTLGQDMPLNQEKN